MSHTPGPWRVIEEVEDNSICIESPTWVVARAYVDVAELEEEGPANARLIAAAPELLKALKACHLQLLQNNSPHEYVMEACDLASAAIAKAEVKP